MSTIDWQQQTILLTGASGGLGRELVRQLSARGARVIMIARQRATLQTLGKTYGQPWFVLDLNAADAVQQLSDYLSAQNLRVTGLINNAGQSSTGTFASRDAATIEQLLNTNLIAPIKLTHALLPQLQQQQGWVLNIGSVFGAIGYPGQTLYCASKFGLHGFTQALARELAGTGVKVLYAAPRAIATDMNQGLMAAMNERLGSTADKPAAVAEQLLKQIEQQRPEQTLGWPEKLFVKINGAFPQWVAASMRKPQRLLFELMQEKRT